MPTSLPARPSVDELVNNLVDVVLSMLTGPRRRSTASRPDPPLPDEARVALDLRRPVVAVFGPNNPSLAELGTARVLGAAVGRRRSLLLTGGDRVDADTVKDGAIVAMVGAETPEDPASWIGVANRRHADAPQRRGPASVVVSRDGSPAQLRRGRHV